MPRRNQYILLLSLLAAVVCYHRAGGAHGRHYGPMAEAFVTALSDIRDRYLYPTDERELFEGAMRGMLEQLNDRNSAYMGAAQTRKFREELGQAFGGIGIEVTWDRETGALTVLSPIFGTPAYEKGMMSGDKILQIDDESTKGFSLQDAVDRLRGEEGEPVRLTVLHEGAAEPVELTITRAIINVDAVLGDVRRADGNWDFRLQAAPEFGYVRITQFGEKTSEEFHKALAQLRKAGVKGLILDLRGNPGGLLNAANDVCNQFIRQGTIVTTRDRTGRIIDQYDADGGAKFTDWPLAVLVDGDSASASEIVSACLQDHQRAVVVGERTFGKGTVQAPIELEGGKSMMRLTIAGFWRPNGKNIHRRDDDGETDQWGVSPSPGYEVKLDDEQRLAVAQERRRRDALPAVKNAPPGESQVVDPQLHKALEYLRKQTGIVAPKAA